MAVRPVVVYPHPDLKRPADPVGRPAGIAAGLAQDLVDTMRASPACVGLAAPQIGVPLRAFCLDVTGHRLATTSHGLVVLFDPRAEEQGKPEVRREGCLSLPHLTADVARAPRVVVRGTGVDGRDLTIEAEGFEARALLHEIDHLDGRLILDRVAAPHALFPRRVYR